MRVWEKIAPEQKAYLGTALQVARKWFCTHRKFLAHTWPISHATRALSACLYWHKHACLGVSFLSIPLVPHVSPSGQRPCMRAFPSRIAEMRTIGKCFLIEVAIITTKRVGQAVAKFLEAQEEDADEREDEEREPAAARLRHSHAHSHRPASSEYRHLIDQYDMI